LIYRDELYSLRLDKTTDELIQLILRNYTGVFSDDVYIDESWLGSRIGKTRKEVYDMLIALAKMGYIQYVPQKKTPLIVFTTSREDTQFVSIPRVVYEERKNRFDKRISSMIDYVERTSVCRSRMLLIYFGEKNPKDCGHCDVCLKKNEIGLSNFEFQRIKEKLLAGLKENNSQKINNLLKNIENESDEKVIKVVRFLVDVGELGLRDDKIFMIH
jgi:ATP-dependent DNA helicase RecQ